MSSITEFPPAPSWADTATEVSEVSRTHLDPGYRTYERLTVDITKAGWLTGPDDALGPHSDVTVGVGRTDGDDGRIIGSGVFVALRGDEALYFDAETARKAAAALLEAADLLDEAVKA